MEDGVHVRSNEEMKGVWKSHFERSVNENKKGSNSVEHGCGSWWKA